MERVTFKLLGFITIVLFLIIQSCGSGKEKDSNAMTDSFVMEDVTKATAEEKKEDAAKDAMPPSPGQEKEGDKDLKTWKRSQQDVNKITLFVGDDEQVETKGMQITVKIDGFRARVLADCFFYNERDWQMEGTFKMRLPNGASPYYFAFGETVYLDKDKLPFNNYESEDTINLSPSGIIQDREKTWANTKEARVVPKEKAAFAYSSTVRRQIDPALAEWAGADVFNCRVFPIMPKKLHRIVIGYDINLTEIGNDKVFNFEIPETNNTLILDFDIANIHGVKTKINPSQKTKSKNNRTYFQIKNPEYKNVEVRYSNLNNLLLVSENNGEEKYFASSIIPELPLSQQNNIYNEAIIAVDVSASSNPDNFNIWLKLLEAVLKNNQDKIQKFNVLFYNVESFFWKENYVTNNNANIKDLMVYCQSLILEGATDIGTAIDKAVNFDNKSKNIFLLSDGSITWGEDEFYSVTKSTKENKVFVFNTALSGTDNNFLQHVTRETGGAVFSVSGEDEVNKASKAFRNIAWKIESIKMTNCDDILIQGRPNYLYSGQNIIVTGRGNPSSNSKLVMELSQGGKKITKTFSFSNTVKSELTKRVYGQTAVSQLESFDYLTEKFSIPYAVHFSVPGKTCSMLMLETEEDYKRFNINNEENLFVIKSNKVSDIISSVINNLKKVLGNAKASFMNMLDKLSKTQGVEFQMPVALESIIKQTPESSFDIKNKELVCKKRNSNKVSKKVLDELKKSKPDYDYLVEEAMLRLKENGKQDALKALSTLIERNPGDGVMIRDVAFSASEWNLNEQAYYLFKRVLKSRPYEPQTYHAIANSLILAGKIDMAVLYFEIAITAGWDERFGDFHIIAGMDYLRLLKMINQGKYKVSFPEYAKSRFQTLNKQYGSNESDLIITIAWNTDNTDIDLHVIEPTGEECFYSNPNTKIGGKLTKDVTQGYGPEMYVLKNAKEGEYKIKAKYFSNDRNRSSTRTKVYATIYQNFGKRNENVGNKVITLEDNKEFHDIMTLKIRK